jgi:ABC-type antimicrobial peptide transport system permease subunit
VGLPLPAVLSARRSFARPGRSGLATLNLALAVVAIVGTLGMEASLNIATVPPPAPPIVPGLPEVPAWDPVDDDAGEGATLRPVVYGLDGLLLLVGLTSLLATLVLTTREQTRDLGVLKAVGLTPRQLLGTVLSSQGVVALAAGLVGIPLGLGLFRLAIQLSGSTDEFAYPAVWTLPVIVVGVVGAVVAIATPLSRWTSSLRVADALRYE